MRAPVTWIRDHAALDEAMTGRQLADALIRAGLEVETVEQIGAEVSGPVVVGRVLSAVREPQKNGKTISWCRVDCGPAANAEAAQPAPEGEPASRGIVCGAPNVVEGALVVVALPGAVLPGGFAIAARKTYGHLSDGMICAEDELGIGEDHAGIIILPDTDAEGRPITPGQEALPLLEERDEVLDIAVTPDLGYCLSIRGLAREAAQACAVAFTDPVTRTTPPAHADGFPVRSETSGCPLFVAVTVEGLDPAAHSPEWMRRRLTMAGMRPISLAVDVTNYVMLEIGQPLHAYDGDRLTDGIVVRQAAAGERLVTLDGVDRALDEGDIVITDGSGVIGLAGVMGGEDTEITEATTRVVLEAAYFAPVPIARTSKRVKLSSEASKRFERGIDPGAAFAAAHRAADLLVEFGGGQVTGETVYGAVPVPPRQRVAADLPARILGHPIAPVEAERILRASGVDVALDGDDLVLDPPTWRPDLVDPYDYVEEVGRKTGFDVIAPVVPTAPAGRGLTPAQKARRALTVALPQAGFVEVIQFPFAAESELDRLGVTAEDDRRRLVRLANPLADTAPYLRTSLLPGLFAAVARNAARGQTDLALYERGLVFFGPAGVAPVPPVDRRPSEAEWEAINAALPEQPEHLACVVTGQWLPSGWAAPAQPAQWRHAVHFVETVAATLGVEVARLQDAQAPWHPGRCARFIVGETTIGHAGELHPSVCQAFDLPAGSAAAEIDVSALMAAVPGPGQLPTLSSYPILKQDVALVVSEKEPQAAVAAALREGAGDLLESLALFDVYRGSSIPEGSVSLAFALRFRAPDRTLTEAEATAARDAAVAEAARRCGAELRAV